MPDISMCQNKDCKLSKACYRFNATPSRFQSYSAFKPAMIKGAVTCDSYMPSRATDITFRSNTST